VPRMKTVNISTTKTFTFTLTITFTFTFMGAEFSEEVRSRTLPQSRSGATHQEVSAAPSARAAGPP
jgi:hypothetical protein